MTVKEIIEELKKYPEDMEVCIYPFLPIESIEIDTADLESGVIEAVQIN